jgi:hypothetical protein
MADLRATPMVNPVMGLLADRLKKVQQFGAKPFGYENPPVEMLMNLLGVPAVQQTMERMAYGEPLTTGRGMTTKPRAEAVEAAMAVAPVAGLLGKATKGLPVGASIKNVGEELIYHGTSPKAAKAIEKSGFDVSKSADGTIWFTSNPNIGEVAATGKGAVVKRFLNEKKMKLGGWDETDKYSTDELIQKGFDGLKLVDDETGEITYQIFNPEKLSVNKSYSYPQQEALDTAKRNAALPIEEGGLGLPKDNTPEMRAKAMGYDVPAYHGTTVWEADDGRKLGDIEAFNRLASTEIVGRKPSLDQVGIWASDRPDELGAGMYSGSQGAIYPLMLRMENPKTTSFEQMARTASNLSSGEPLGAGVVPRVSDVEPYRQMLKEQDFDSLMIKAKQGSPYTEFADQTGYVLLEPSQVRSRFAAFDPMRRNEADILAGVLPLGLLADEEQRKKIYELMPSLLGQ